MELLNLSYHRRKTNGYRDIDPEAPGSKAVFVENLEKLLGRLLAAICATVTFSEVVKRCPRTTTHFFRLNTMFFRLKHHAQEKFNVILSEFTFHSQFFSRTVQI